MASTSDPLDYNFKEIFFQRVTEYEQQHQGSQKKPWTDMRILEVIQCIKNANIAGRLGKRRTAMDYYYLSKYDVVIQEGQECLVQKTKKDSKVGVRIIPKEQYFDLLFEVHEGCNHGARDKMVNLIQNKRFYVPKKVIEFFINLCPKCESKRNVNKTTSSRLTIVQEFNIRGQVDIIDFQSSPDGEYKWLLVYQDYNTKFINLRPIKTKRASEVAGELLKIFLTFGAPTILQSGYGREFASMIIEELKVMWPHCTIVHGKCHDGSAIKNCQDIKSMLQSWMTDNNLTNWSVGCYFIENKKNTSFNSLIRKSPYKALFGFKFKAGLSDYNIPMSVETEEQLENMGNLEGYLKRNVNNDEETENSANTTADDCHNMSPDDDESLNSCNIVCEIKEEVISDEENSNCSIDCRRNDQRSIKRVAEEIIVDSLKKPCLLNNKDRLSNTTSVKIESVENTSLTPNQSTKEEDKIEIIIEQKCTCKNGYSQCRNNRCPCIRNKIKCGSLCHVKESCENT